MALGGADIGLPPQPLDLSGQGSDLLMFQLLLGSIEGLKLLGFVKNGNDKVIGRIIMWFNYKLLGNVKK